MSNTGILAVAVSERALVLNMLTIRGFDPRRSDYSAADKARFLDGVRGGPMLKMAQSIIDDAGTPCEEDS